MWLDVKSVKGRKEWKDEEIKGRGHSAIWAEGRKEVKSQSVRTSAVLKNCVSESKQKRREK